MAFANFCGTKRLHPQARRPRAGLCRHDASACAAPASRPARARLDALVAQGGRAATGVSAEEVDAAVQALVAEGGEEGAGVWREGLVGRWGLRFSTEAGLRRVVAGGGGSVGEVVQVVRGGGRLENVVRFGRGRFWAEVCVGVDYEMGEGEERVVRFVFTDTEIKVGGLGAVKLPFAVGRGEFRCVWLDQMRVDICDVGGGERWINVYGYEGPVERCQQ